MGRRLRVAASVLAAVAVAALASPVVVAEEAQPDGFETEVVQIPTRAGERLRGYLSFPTSGGVRLSGPFPVVLEYSPYCDPGSKALWTSNGYVYAGVQVPGACGSEGHFTIFEPPVGRAGYDAVEWLATQSWSTGKVGMVGASAPGIAQLHTAREKPPHLTTIAPSIASLDFYDDLVYPGGILNPPDVAVTAGIIAGVMMLPGLGYRFDSAEGMRRMATNDEWVPDDTAAQVLLHPLKDEFWTMRNVDPADIDVPILALGNWDDFFTKSATRLFTDTPRPDGRSNNRLVIGGDGHSGTPGPGYDGDAETVRWMDHWLKGIDNGVAEQIVDEPVEYYVLGGGWKTAKSWPPSPDTTTLRFGGGDTATGADGVLTTDAVEPGSLSYAYAPGASTSVSHDGFFPFAGEQRGAVTSLTYATEPLTSDLEVTGRASVTLQAATTAQDTDWIVRLVDIAPDGSWGSGDNRYGSWRFVMNGQLRASHRGGHDHLEPVPAGESVAYTIDLRPVSYLFEAGHRIGLQVASADPTRSATTPYPALNTVFHGSSLALPVGSSSA